MTWFETLVGFPEESSQQVRNNISVDGETLKSHVNGKILICGQLETPTLAELRERVHSMVSPRVTPEDGVGIYERDRTQGPACAIAAGAGTIYRNYFAIANGQIGQSANNRLFLTLLGGGAFGNETDWIIGGIQRALNLYKHIDLDVAIVSYGSSKKYIQQLVHQYSIK